MISRLTDVYKYKYTNILSILDAAHIQLFSIMKATLKHHCENNTPHWVMNHAPQRHQHVSSPIDAVGVQPTTKDLYKPNIKQIRKENPKTTKLNLAQLVQNTCIYIYIYIYIYII